jgi:hypothetical protein
VSEKLSLPIAVFAIEAMSLTILTTLGLMTTTLVVISAVALIAFVWNRGKGIPARTVRDRPSY